MIRDTYERYTYRSGGAWLTFWSHSAASAARDLDENPHKSALLCEYWRGGALSDIKTAENRQF
jgi:hypothetical protein